MKKVQKLQIIICLLLTAFSGVSYSGDLPDGWYQFKKSSDSKIETGTDENIFYSKPNSFYLKSTSGRGGNINQKIKGTQYAGKRIKLSAYLKSENVVDNNNTRYGVQLWAYSYSDSDLYMTSSAGNIKGTTDWKKYTIVFDVPKNTPSITYGLSVSGQGLAWIDSISWEVVDKETTPIKNATYANDKPNNLP